MLTIHHRTLTLVIVIPLLLVATFIVGVRTADALTANCFTDVSEGQWFHDYVCWMFDNGLTAGYPDGTFRPADFVNRAQMAVFLQQLSGHGTAGPIVDADMLDGQEGSYYQNATNLTSGNLGWSRLPAGFGEWAINTSSGSPMVIRTTVNPTAGESIFEIQSSGSARRLYVEHDGALGTENDDILIGSAQHRVWHEGNDGASSGLDADTIDGLEYGSQTGYLSAPAAAFTPSEDGYNYQNLGAGLIHTSGPTALYLAPMNLPHGATVTRLTFYWSDTSAGEDGGAMLYRTSYTGSFNFMVSPLSTNGSAGPGSSTTTSITYSVIDNSQYGYFVVLSLPNSNIAGLGVIIEYTYDSLG